MADTSHYAHCRTLLARFRRNHIRRVVVLGILLVLNFYVHVLTFGVKYGGPSFAEAQALERGISMLPFGMGMATLICSLIALVVGFFAEAKRPKLTFILIGLIVLCALADFIHWLLAAVIVAVYLFNIKEIINYRWVTEQPGFPHFSERFEEQLENSEFKPLYKMDGKREAEMIDLKEGEADYSLDLSKRHAEMPDIPGIPSAEPEKMPVSLEKTAAPLPESDPFPDTPDPVTDTSVILSDPMANFPDLPDIPDIPKL